MPFDDFDTQVQCEEVYDFVPTDDDYMEELMRSSLMDRAGLKKRDQKRTDTSQRKSLD